MPAQCPNLKRCPSENGLFSPIILKPDLWLDGADLSTIITRDNQTSVRQWLDKSGYGRNVSQSTDASQPTLVTNSLNGLSGLDWGSSANAKGLSTSAQLVAAQVFAVAKYDGANPFNAYASIYCGDPSFFRPVFTGSSGTSWISNSQNHLNGAAASATALPTISSPFIVRTANANTSSATRTASYIGADSGFFSGRSWIGKIYEIIIFPTILSDRDALMVEGSLAWKWGLYSFLPESNPYRFSPPRDNRILTRKRRSLILLAGSSGVSGGGTTYNESVSETASSADSAATALTALSACTESATAADVIDAALSLQAALAESAASSDDLSSTATLAVVLSEILSALDTVTTGSVFSDTITESAAADAVKSALMEMSTAISESASASDAHDTALTAVNAILEASAASESLSTTQTLAATLAESLAAIFAVTNGSIYFDTLGESAVADATKSSMMAMVSALSESSTATDANATTLASVNALLESLAAGDNNTPAQTMAATLAESLASLFAVAEGNVFSESLAESAGLADAIAAGILSNVSFAESASPSDAQSVAAVLADVINEAILAGSSQAAQAVFADALAETLLALAVESSAVVGEIISPAAILTNRVKSVLTASQKVHDLLGMSLGTLGNVARPRIFTGQARTFLCGRNRGRLPFFEIHVSGQSFDHESYSAGAITQTALLTIHLGGKDPGAAGLLAERVLLASMAAIRNGSDNLLALGNDVLGDLEQGPWGHRRTMTFTVTQTYDRTTYEVP